MTEETGSLEKKLEKDIQSNQSISYLLNEFESKIEPFLKETYKENYTEDSFQELLNKYSAALFIDYVTKKTYSEAKIQHKSKSINTYSRLFIINARKYINEFNKSINKNNIKNIIKTLEEEYLSKSEAKISHRISHLRNNYTQGVISTLYNVLYSGCNLESIGKAIKEGSRIGTSGEKQPKFREYWGIEKQLKKLNAK